MHIKQNQTQEESTENTDLQSMLTEFLSQTNLLETFLNQDFSNQTTQEEEEDPLAIPLPAPPPTMSSDWLIILFFACIFFVIAYAIAHFCCK
jgi:hypothetical protein